MPKVHYISKSFSKSTRVIIDQANEIIEEYQEKGYDLTLRQLFYQFVSRDYISNKDSEYKRLGSIISDARMAGLIDWEAIVDRTRNLRENSHWDDPASIIRSAARSFAVDKWEDQPRRPEVWIEKDALIGILEQACEPLDVPYFSCRGYTSISEMWVAAQRLIGYGEGRAYIIHLGDHDPSGIDMSRDIQDRLETFGANVAFKRIALNMDQVREYNPPPNPAKVTDARFTGYQELYGDECWELDALNPEVITELIQDAVNSVLDERKWAVKVQEEKRGRRRLERASEQWPSIVKHFDL